MKGSETTTRVLVSAVGVPVALLAVYAGGWVLAGLLGLVAGLAALERRRDRFDLHENILVRDGGVSTDGLVQDDDPQRSLLRRLAEATMRSMTSR